jgi:hypothetical protein
LVFGIVLSLGPNGSEVGLADPSQNISHISALSEDLKRKIGNTVTAMSHRDIDSDWTSEANGASVGGMFVTRSAN